MARDDPRRPGSGADGRAFVAQQPKTLRVAMHADVRTLDPFWTTQTIAGIHGLMVYDTLFSSDAELKPQPQMVDKWTVSEDRKIYTFTLRDGLKFHDGSPVTSKDVVASMNRWGKRDGAGKQLFEYTASLVANDDKTFVWTLKEPYGLLIDILAKTGTSIPFVMREKEAMVDPFQQIQEVVGSGPFVFKRDEWVPGSKTVYEKFTGYVPRKEPASGHAGGKVVKVDRVEFVWLSDPQTAQSALVAGEIDYLENPQLDFLPILESTPGIKIESHPAMGTMGILQLNHLHPPFNNVKARQAMLYIINNADYLNTIAADPKLQKLCFSYFGCDVGMETDAGSETYKGPKDYKKAEALFKEAGYNGEPITILHATDHQYINPANLVHDPAAAQGRLPEARRSGHGLGDCRVPPRQEGATGPRRLEHLHYRHHGSHLVEPDHTYLDRHGLRQGLVRLAVRRQVRGSAQGVGVRSRPRNAQEGRGRVVQAGLRSGAVHLVRAVAKSRRLSVGPALRRAVGAVGPANVEHREEVTICIFSVSRRPAPPGAGAGPCQDKPMRRL